MERNFRGLTSAYEQDLRAATSAVREGYRAPPRAGAHAGHRVSRSKSSSSAPRTALGLHLAPERRADDLARFGEDRVQVIDALEALGVDLVDVLGAGRARGEPAVLGHDLQPADRRPVAGRS